VLRTLPEVANHWVCDIQPSSPRLINPVSITESVSAWMAFGGKARNDRVPIGSHFVVLWLINSKRPKDSVTSG
jgi:hypothetical protein